MELFWEKRSKPTSNETDLGPDIARDEERCVLANMKNEKSTGPDDLRSVLLKFIDDQLHILVDLFNQRKLRLGNVVTNAL